MASISSPKSVVLTRDHPPCLQPVTARKDLHHLLVETVLSLCLLGDHEPLPKANETVQQRSLTPDDVRKLIDAARGERLGALVVVGLGTGLRPGELTALCWDDIDLGKEVLTVRRSLKRDSGKTLRLDVPNKASASLRSIRLAPPVVTALQEHRKRQEEEQLRVGSVWSTEWPDLIFTTENGTPIDPSNLRRLLRKLSRRAGLEQHVIPYVFRHTTTSLLIDAGVSVEAVADVLGDRPVTVLRHYRHRVREVADAAVAPMTALLASSDK